MSSEGTNFRELFSRSLAKIVDLKAQIEKLESVAYPPIAVIGMSCRFPGGGVNPEAFWRGLEVGVDGIVRIPETRWKMPAGGEDNPATRWAGLLDSVDGFDAAFFGISPREATRLDPQQRLLLELAWEALEGSGQAIERLMGTPTGVFLAISSSDYLQLAMEHPPLDFYNILGGALNTAAGRLAYTFGLQGPCMTLDTACSSSLTAVHLACQSLRSGESNLALAGGVNLILIPRNIMMNAQLQAMSPEGRCKTFDAEANGFALGEGGGVILLKRVADAERDGDPILAVIRSSAVSHDGRSAGLTAPSALAQQALLRRSLELARLSPEDIGLVETHGTGTVLGDPIEVEALRAVLGKPRPNGSPCALGAVKTNVGHTASAAGMASLIKAVLCLQHEAIPPNLHFRTLNPRISLSGTPFVIPTETLPWKSSGKPRRAGVSAFGISGTNAHIIVEEAPRPHDGAAHPESSYLLPLSAKTPEALAAMAKSYGQWLATNPDVALEHIAYTACIRRSHHEYRLGAVGATRQDLAEALAASAAGALPAGVVTGRATAKPPKVVFVFAEPGAPWVDLGRQLPHQEPAFSEALAACDAAIGKEAGFSLLSALARPAATSRLAEIEVGQPVLFALAVALAALWRSWGIEPRAVIGHGLGELAAAVVAGAYSLADAAAIICRCSRLRGKHGLQLEPLRQELLPALTGLSPQPPRTPWYSTVTGALVRGNELSAAYWADNLSQPVQFSRAVAQSSANGPTVFLEISPHPSLTRSIAESLRERSADGVALSSLCKGQDGRQSLLAALGALYVRGAAVKWQQVLRDGGRVVALPTYPWQRQRYWLELRAAAQHERPAKDRTARDGLLGRRFSVAALPSTRLWDAELGLDQPLPLAERRTWEEAALPWAVYLELLLEAARSTPGPGCMLDTFTVLAEPPLGPETAARLQLALTPQGEHESFSLSGTLAATDPSAGSPWRELARGRLRKATTDESSGAPGERLDDVRQRCPQVSAERFYAALTQRGIFYGSGLRVVKEVWAQPGEALGRFALPPPPRQGAGAAQWALLDGCVQLVHAALSPELPPPASFRVHELRGALFGSALPQAPWGHVRLCRPAPDGSLHAAFALVDETGRASVRIADVQLIPVTPSGALADLSDTATVQRILRQIVGQVTALGETELDAERALIDAGLDSLMFLQLLRRAEQSFGVTLSLPRLQRLGVLWQACTLRSLGQLLIDIRAAALASLPADEFLAREESLGEAADDREALAVAQAGPAAELPPAYRALLSANVPMELSLITLSNGEVLEVLCAGTGEPLVLLPPILASIPIWIFQLLDFSRDHRLIIPNYPGYGRSTPVGSSLSPLALARRLEAILDGLGIVKPVNLAGWSMGGMVGQEFALLRPERVRSLALINTTSQLEEEDSLHNLTQVLQRLVADLERPVPGEDATTTARRTLALSTSRSEAGIERNFSYAQQALRFDASKRIHAITAPTLVVQGSRDTLAVPRYGQHIAQKIPQVEYHELADCGHFVPLHAPAEFNRLFRTFLHSPRVRA